MFSVSNNFAEYESQTNYEVKFPNVARQEIRDLDERNKRILEIASEKNYKSLDSEYDDNNQYFYDMEAKIVYEVWPLDEYEDIDEHSHVIEGGDAYKAEIKNPTFNLVSDKGEIKELLTLNAII